MRTLEDLDISPAPWHKYEIKDYVCVDDCNSRIVHNAGIGFEHGCQNASLIAAAPDLYQALREVVEAFDRGDGIPMTIKEARSALAKAEGEEAK